jgi:hypothetical protein
MTPEEQRVAIAEACGWKLKSNGLSPMWSWQNESLIHRIKWVAHKVMASQGVLPDYLNDLNAMHEAEKAMNNNDWWKFVEHLTNICGGGTALGISATSSQRAEAFLRTIGKWKECK